MKHYQKIVFLERILCAKEIKFVCSENEHSFSICGFIVDDHKNCDDISDNQMANVAKAHSAGLIEITASPRSESVYGTQNNKAFKISDHFEGYGTNGFWRPKTVQCVRWSRGFYNAEEVSITQSIDALIKRDAAKPNPNKSAISRTRRLPAY
jgi:hypothetical protein